MSDDTTAGQAGEQTGQEPAPDTTTQVDTGQQSGQPAGSDDAAERIARLEKELEKARAEAAKTRINAKTAAAEQARQELAQQIGRALGLIKDDDAAPDPAELTKQLEAKAASEREALVRLAVYETVDQHGGNPKALTDSRSFLTKVSKLDPTTDDFAAQVAAAATEAVKENPALRAAQAVAPAGGVEFTGGGQGGPARTYTRAQLRDSKFFAEHRDDIMRAMREGRIKE